MGLLGAITAGLRHIVLQPQFGMSSPGRSNRSFNRESVMPVTQLILLAVFGVVVIAWGAIQDMKNHRKEKEAQAVQNNTRA